MDDLKNARKFLEEAAKYEPNEGVIYEHLGEIDAKLEKYDQAIKWFKKALSSRLEKADKSRVESRLKELERKLD